MSFFEPLSEPSPPPERSWAPPLWDRPSEGVIPVALPVNALLHAGSEVAVSLPTLSVYPNGFTVNLYLLANPRTTTGGASFVTSMFGHPGAGDPSQRFPRIGVRFSDGRTAGRDAAHPMAVAPKDDDGIPTQPILTMQGASGSGSGFRYSVWVFPLPPDGPLDLFVALPALGLDETQVTLDGGAIRAAAAEATVIWS